MNGPANGEKKKRKKEKKKKGDREGRKKQKLKATGNCWWASHLRDTLSEGPQNASGPSGSGVGPLPTGNGTGSVPGGARGGEEEDWFQHLTAQERAWRARRDPSYGDVDVFHVQAPEGSLHALWTAAAKKEALLRKNQLMWDSASMSELLELMQEHCLETEIADADTSLLDFNGFEKCRNIMTNPDIPRDADAVPVNREPFLSSKSFYRLPKNEDGCLLVNDIFAYVLKKVSLYQTRIELGINNQKGDSYLTEPELETYFLEVVPSLPPLNKLPPEFYQFYVCGATRKFFFFLDTTRRGRINIDSMMKSPVLAEFIHLQSLGEDDDVRGNWFSAPVAAQVYDEYVDLDTDHDGMLSRQEMYRFGKGNYTNFFIDRFFDVSQTYNGQLDYKKYIEFVLTVQNQGSKPSLELMWRVLDLDEKGVLTPHTIRTFYREIMKKYRENIEEATPPKEEDAVVEIFDLINPKIPFTVTKGDLLRCKQREAVLSMLVNYRYFHDYDNRESMGGAPISPSKTFNTLSSDLERAFKQA